VEERVYCAIRTKLLNKLIILIEFGLESLQYVIKCLVKLEVLRETVNMIIEKISMFCNTNIGKKIARIG
jgi:hypothetical protein